MGQQPDRPDGPVPIVSYVPLFMFAVLFGLSMDYEVFLVSQIEEHKHGGEDNAGAVESGLLTSARVITAAAMIMVFVFGSFVLNGDPTIKQFGVGLAVAVILDASVVRCLLVPAVMILTGERNWWMPRWLERIVPHVSIEGAEFFADFEYPEPPVAGARPRRPGTRPELHVRALRSPRPLPGRSPVHDDLDPAGIAEGGPAGGQALSALPRRASLEHGRSAGARRRPRPRISRRPAAVHDIRIP